MNHRDAHEGRREPGLTGPPLYPMRIRLLGGLDVRVGSRVVGPEEWHLAKARSLVKVLALSPGHHIKREQATDLLWPDLPPEAAANNLRGTLHDIRRALEPASILQPRRLLLTWADEISLCPDGMLWVDVEAFEQAAKAARREGSAAAYEAALGLYAGELLPEDRYEVWAEARREGLRQERLELLLGLAVLRERAGEYDLAARSLRELLAEEPVHETAHRYLMRLYALSGRRTEALAQYRRLRDSLRRDLGVAPDSETEGLREEVSAGRFPTGGQTSGTHPVLSQSLPWHPPRTTLVGREQELEEVTRSLQLTDLLTLTGAGGCGKTRLALEAAKQTAGIHPGGVHLIELAPLSEGELVPQTLARAVGVREERQRSFMETLTEALSGERTLVVLDNCEHVVDEVADLADRLLGSCPNLRILATSREPLGVAGEFLWRVPPLSAPEEGHGCKLSAAELCRYGAARLFLERARARMPGFSLTEANAGTVAEICRRLDGMPLAIELAAARLPMLAVEQVTEKLADSLGLLSAGPRTASARQRTMRATLEWSYGLLSREERYLFARLSVFAGLFSPEAAEEVAVGTDSSKTVAPGEAQHSEGPDPLSRLVEKSLVSIEPAAGAARGPRYRMLEPVRQYAGERLEESGAAEEARRRHALWTLGLAEEAERGSNGPSHGYWMQRLDEEHGNLQAALGHSIQAADAETALRLSAALWPYWFAHGHLDEGRAWIERAASLEAGPEVQMPRARSLSGAGYIALFQGDFRGARALLEEGLAIFRQAGDEEGTTACLVYLGYVAVLGERPDIPVADLLEEALSLRSRIGDRRTIANMLVLEGLVAGLVRGDLDRAVVLHEEALSIFQRTGDNWGTNLCHTNLGLLWAGRAEPSRALSHLMELARSSRELSDRVTAMYAFLGLGCVAGAEGEGERAARLWGVSEGTRQATSLQLNPATRAFLGYETRLAAARAMVGTDAFEEAWAEGENMSLEKAYRYALGEGRQPRRRTPSSAERVETRPAEAQEGELTRREKEIALLMASGLTNRLIARELSISERTVATHVGRILKKLGVDSRKEVASRISGRSEPLDEQD